MLRFLRFPFLYAVMALLSLSAKAQIDPGLFTALKNCDLPAVQKIVKHIQNINATDSNGATALMWAVYYCDLPIVKYLTGKGAASEDSGVIYFEEDRAKFYGNTTGLAAGKGKLQVLQYLADSLHRSPNEKGYDPFRRKKVGWTPMLWAVYNGQTDVIDYLMQKGVPVDETDEEGNTPLTMAAEKEQWDIFELMMKKSGKEKLGKEYDHFIHAADTLYKKDPAKGDWNKLLTLRQFIVQLSKAWFGEEHISYAASLNNLAELFYNMGQYEKALPLFDQVTAIYKKALGEEHSLYANSLNNLAVLSYFMGRYEKALPLFDQVTAILKKTFGEKHPNYAMSLNNLANSYQAIGQYEKAIPLIEKTLVIQQKVIGKDHPDYAQSLNNLATLYDDMGQYEKAMPLHEQARATRKKSLGEEHPDYTQSLNNLAMLYHAMGRYEKALTFLKHSIVIEKKILGEEHPLYAISLNNLATLYGDMRQYEKALPLFEQARAIRKKSLGEEHPDNATSLNNLAVLYVNMGRYEKALSLLTDASTLTLKHLNRTYTTLTEQEKMTLLAKKTSRFNNLPSLLYTQHIYLPSALKQAYTNELVLKGMVLEDQKEVLNSIRKSSDSTALQLYDQWSFLKKSIGRQLLLPIAKRVPYFDSLQERATRLEQDLSRRSAAFRSQQQKQNLTSKDIIQKLSKEQAAIEFIRFPVNRKKQTDSTLYAALLLLAGDTAVHFIPLFEERQLKRLLSPLQYGADVAVQKLYRGLEVGNNETVVPDDSLYRLIWKPMERYLRGIKTVSFAPAGLLHRVAFGALRVDSGHFLMDKYRLNQVLSTRSIAFPEPVSSHLSTAGIWGNIQYSLTAAATTNASGKHNIDTTASSFNFYTADTKKRRGTGKAWSPLPGTLQEIDSLKQVFQSYKVNSSTYNGSEASEEQFKALDGKSQQLLHIATHGFFLPLKENQLKNKKSAGYMEGNPFTVQQNPMFRSGLVLAGANYAWKGGAALSGKEDGILTAYEIAQMDLSGTDLVVLSACETALGDVQGSEGVIGMQRAFKLAGVKQMILSLWRVPDNETAELMTLFYRNRLSGQSTGDALRSAQLKMKEKYSPYYWAAFVLVE